jgi:hypothetical protein
MFGDGGVEKRSEIQSFVYIKMVRRVLPRRLGNLFFLKEKKF